MGWPHLAVAWRCRGILVEGECHCLQIQTHGEGGGGESGGGGSDGGGSDGGGRGGGGRRDGDVALSAKLCHDNSKGKKKKIFPKITHHPLTCYPTRPHPLDTDLQEFYDIILCGTASVLSIDGQDLVSCPDALVQISCLVLDHLLHIDPREMVVFTD